MIDVSIVEEKVFELFQEGNDLIRGPVHSYIGEEAVAVGACAALRDNDVITSTHRVFSEKQQSDGDLAYTLLAVGGILIALDKK